MADTSGRGAGKRAGSRETAASKKTSGRAKKKATKRAPSVGAKGKVGRKPGKTAKKTAAKNKTQKTSASVADYIAAISDPERRADCEAVAAMMEKIVGEPGRMWGSALVGFGEYHYVYDSGREGDFFLTGFSSRARNLTLYIMAGFAQYDDLMDKLGPHTTGKSCLYVKRLSDLHLPTLRKLITASVRHMRKRYDA